MVRHGDPWLPMPGTGADDVAGVIPYAAVPQVYDPPGHVVATANQRPVGPSYPYYIGTSANFFDPGYRAGQIYASLRGQHGMSPASVRRDPASLTDRAGAADRAPAAGRAARAAHLTAQQQQAAALLDGWNGAMAAELRGRVACGGRSGATTWTRCSGRGGRRPRCRCTRTDGGLAVSPDQVSLDQVLESWTPA